MPFELNRRTRWILIALLCLAGAAGAWLLLEWSGYVQGWVGALFRAASGGALGWLVSRWVLGLDLSEIPAERRPVSALSQALLIGCFAVAVAVGV